MPRPRQLPVLITLEYPAPLATTLEDCMHLTDHYLELLKRAINNYLYLGKDTPFEEFEVMDFSPIETGWLIPEIAQPHGMTATVQLNALQSMMYDVIMNNVPGDFIEAGVYKGGAAMFMRAFLKSNNITDRTVWAADSFEGIPVSKKFSDIGDPVDEWTDRWVAPYDEVINNFRRYDLLDDQVKFLRGYFEDTLPDAPIGKLALARLDGDSYESTMDALEGIYPRMSEGGYVIVQDWHLEFCRKAAIEFRKAHGIVDPINHIVCRRNRLMDYRFSNLSINVQNRVLGHESFWKVGSGAANSCDYSHLTLDVPGPGSDGDDPPGIEPGQP